MAAHKIWLPGLKDIRNYGGAGDGTTDDYAAYVLAKAAADAIGTGVYLPGGYTWKFASSITMPTNGDLVGDGKTSTTVHFTTDAGAGNRAITFPGSTAGRVIRGMKIQGPGSGFTVNVSPANMDGPLIAAKCGIEHCRVEGFHSGVVIANDHTWMRNVVSTNNYYNLEYPSGTTAQADRSIHDCQLDGATFASVCVDPTNCIESESWDNVHLGFAPYCIYRPSGTPTKNFLYRSAFKRVSMEAVGNGLIYDENATTDSHSTINLCKFDSTSGGGPNNATYKISARAADYAVVVGAVTETRIDGDFLTSPFAVAIFDCQYSGLNNVAWSTGRNIVVNLQAAPTKRFASSLTGIQVGTVVIDSEASRVEVWKCPGAAVAVGDLTETFSYGCQKWSGANSVTVGVALCAATGSGDCTLVTRAGLVNSVKATGVIGGQNWVKPDTGADGFVIVATGPSDGPAIGYSASSASGGVVTLVLRGLV